MLNPENISRFLIKNKGILAFVSFVILLISSAQIYKITITGNLGGFNASEEPLFEDAKSFDSLFGEVKSKVFISITPKKNSNHLLWKECAEIESKIRNTTPGVSLISPRRYVRAYYSLYDAKNELPSDSILDHLSKHPQLKNLVSKDHSSFLILLHFEKDSIPVKELEKLTTLSGNQINEIRIFGVAQLEKAIEETIVKDILIISFSIAIFFGIFLFWVYRSISVIVFSVIMMGASIWMTLCLYPMLGYEINLISVLALPIILVLSLSDAIHLLSGFSHHYETSSLLSKYIAPSFYSSLTTSIAFFTFSFSDSPYIKELGILTGVALIIEFILSFSIAPFILGFVKIQERPPSLLVKITSSILKHQKIISLFLFIVSISSIFLIPKLKFKSDTNAFFPKNHIITQNHNFFNSQYYSQVSCHIWFDNHNSINRDSFLSESQKIIKKIGSHPLVLDYNSIEEANSLNEIIPTNLRSKKNLFANFINADSSILRCEYYFKEANQTIQFYQDCKKKGWLTSSAVRIHITSSALIFDYINHQIAKTLLYSLLTSGIAIVFMLFFITKSWKQALLGLLPNLVPLSIAVWVFYVFGLSLNILTALTATVCIGLLDDDTIHILYRKFILKEEIDTLAFSIINTAVLLAFGFGVFVISNFYPTQVFGGVSALVFLFGVLGELTLFQFITDWINNPKKNLK